MFTDLFVAAAVAAAVGWFGLGMDPCERWCCSPASPVVVVCVSGRFWFRCVRAHLGARSASRLSRNLKAVTNVTELE
jgi:hypothetical protein